MPDTRFLKMQKKTTNTNSERVARVDRKFRQAETAAREKCATAYEMEIAIRKRKGGK